MDKFIFPFFMEIFDEKKGGDRRQDQISMGHPYFTFLFLHFSVKREQWSIEFFSLLPVDKERLSYVD